MILVLEKVLGNKLLGNKLLSWGQRVSMKCLVCNPLRIKYSPELWSMLTCDAGNFSNPLLGPNLSLYLSVECSVQVGSTAPIITVECSAQVGSMECTIIDSGLREVLENKLLPPRQRVSVSQVPVLKSAESNILSRTLDPVLTCDSILRDSLGNTLLSQGRKVSAMCLAQNALKIKYSLELWMLLTCVECSSQVGSMACIIIDPSLREDPGKMLLPLG
ncbi:uncharacterized protein LOC103264020 isoform X1 [Carlito syrichta]|uniref:Uncharacterized protein LOC103264020 isoform X1 n=1 Tax=Carlito syrichta TaxID=1868482 RepID=A0A1U7U3K6_CARSF|nr:uncharacterized protein LOC103264020 isoform X1 [Carlito syrichta]XP_021569907.1 uncharacterized protein LOC103264020 isoform X1 [Carlito syrichta]XP_021569908.1 uncharacterized protein LOC103264020 isoform X1 [Carlito syrichta]